MPYNRQKAVQYANKWALDRNPDYYNFDELGGDCTNFISQCLYAGSGVMNYTPTFGWYYRSLNDRTPSWTGVEFMYNFLTTNRGPGPYGVVAPLIEVRPGDIIQLSFDGEVFSHTLFVLTTGILPFHNNILVASHSQDALNRPLSTYTYQKLRMLKINAR